MNIHICNSYTEKRLWICFFSVCYPLQYGAFSLNILYNTPIIYIHFTKLSVVFVASTTTIRKSLYTFTLISNIFLNVYRSNYCVPSKKSAFGKVKQRINVEIKYIRSRIMLSRTQKKLLFRIDGFFSIIFRSIVFMHFIVSYMYTFFNCKFLVKPFK